MRMNVSGWGKKTAKTEGERLTFMATARRWKPRANGRRGKSARTDKTSQSHAE
jgi:hypothetical protein